MVAGHSHSGPAGGVTLEGGHEPPASVTIRCPSYTALPPRPPRSRTLPSLLKTACRRSLPRLSWPARVRPHGVLRGTLRTALLPHRRSDSDEQFWQQIHPHQRRQSYEIFRLSALEQKGIPLGRLPFSLRILLENLLRHEDGKTVTADDIEFLAKWDPKAEPSREIALHAGARADAGLYRRARRWSIWRPCATR